MRVIAGEHKGRQLKAVPGKSTRPTTDKVKEAVFQIMGPFFEGGNCLDLFAGSGSLGIEALSRGVEHVTFVDQHPKAIQTIKENINTLKLADKVDVFRADSFRALKALSKRDLKFDLILLDPPYSKVDYIKLIDDINKFNLVENYGLIYCEYESTGSLPENIEGFTRIKNITYGKTSGISIYRKGTNHE